MGKARALIDTDVVSFLFNKHPLGISYRQYLRKRTLCISFMTCAEIERGMRQADWGEHRKNEMRDFIADKFTVISSNDPICIKWGDILVLQLKKGRPISFADAWIAATALVYKIPIITHNRKHFETIDELKVISGS